MPAPEQDKPKPQIIRPVPTEIDKAIEEALSSESLNFGLYFNKWLKVSLYEKEHGGKKLSFPEYKFQARVGGKNSGSDDGVFQASEALANYQKIKGYLKAELKKRLSELKNVCDAFEKIGYSRFSKDAVLKTPLIIGLGNANPIERGFTFHHTLGIPYIPAESIKGVVRLAYLVDLAQNDPGFFEHWGLEDGVYMESVKDVFGCSREGERSSSKGKVIFMDALPVDVPELTLEITTCHYGDYYKGARGPTEDQNPNPIPFLAVASGSKFQFNLLLAAGLSADKKEKLVKAFEFALTEHGFGAKTALGHGRFSENTEQMEK